MIARYKYLGAVELLHYVLEVARRAQPHVAEEVANTVLGYGGVEVVDQDAVHVVNVGEGPLAERDDVLMPAMPVR